jgi:hypothetical protein
MRGYPGTSDTEAAPIERELRAGMPLLVSAASRQGRVVADGAAGMVGLPPGRGLVQAGGGDT